MDTVIKVNYPPRTEESQLYPGDEIGVMRSDTVLVAECEEV